MLPKLTDLTREETIGQYHMLMKQLAAVDRDVSFPTPAAKDARKALLRAQLKVIGMDRYQQASRAGEHEHGGFDSSQWVLSIFKSRDDVAALAQKPRKTSAFSVSTFPASETSTTAEPDIDMQSSLLLRVLDVGAIVHRFPQSVHLNDGREIQLDVTSIDLNPAKESEDEGTKRVAVATPRVLQADIIEFSREHLKQETKLQFDAIVLSLCVNFEGSPWRRGEMLYYASKILRKKGLLFLVLPLQCVQNSRYCDENKLQQVLDAVGLDVVSKEATAALLQWTAAKRDDHEYGNSLSKPGPRKYEQLGKKHVIRAGTSRNNFSICLDVSLLRDESSIPATSLITHKNGEATRRKKESRRRRVSPSKTRGGVDKSKRITSNQRKRARKLAKGLTAQECRQGKGT